MHWVKIINLTNIKVTTFFTFVLLSVFSNSLFTSPIYADTNDYCQTTHGSESSKKSKLSFKNRPLCKNDPELIAFYKSLFNQEVKQTVINNKFPKIAQKNRIQRTNDKKATPPSIFIQKTKVDARTNPIQLNPNENGKNKSQLIPKKNIKDSNTKLSTNSSSKEDLSTSKSNSQDLSALFAKAFGKKVAKGPPEVTVDFRVNKSTLGDIKLFSNASGIIDQADAQQLNKLLQDVIKEHAFEDFKQHTDNKEKIPISDLNKFQISAIYNSTNLSLDLDVPTALRKPLIISMINKKSASVRKENKIKAQEISSYINLFSDVGFNSSSSTSDLKMKLEGSLNIKGKVLETTLDYRDKKFISSKTTLTYDRPGKLHRIVLGNISTGNRNFQENLELNGIRISKEFFMNPELKIRPRANESFVLDTDSEVEVFINNRLHQRFYLNEGVYSLEDIGLYDGANNIQIRIKDAFGKITVKSSEEFFDSHLLKPGLSLFALSVGYLSNKELYSNELLHKKPIFSGYYKKGVNKDLTIGLDAQFSPNSYLLGAESLTSIPIGTIKNSIAYSNGDLENTKSGFATSFEFKPNKKIQKINLETLKPGSLGLAPQKRGFLNNWTLSGEYRSRHFSLLNGVNEQIATTSSTSSNHQLKYNLQSNFNLRLNHNWNGYLNVGTSDYYDSDQSYYVNLSTSRRFNNGTRLSLGARYDTEDDFSVNLQLSVPLSREKGRRKKDFDLLVNSKNQLIESKLSIKPTSNVGRNSLAAYLEHYQDDNSKYQNLDVQYRQPSYEAKFNARNRNSKNNSSQNQEFHIGLNTGIACVGLECAQTLPIQDSFALVSGPSNQTQPIAINNNNNRFKYSGNNASGLPDNYTTLIPSKDQKAVVSLESYRFQNINIAESTLPFGYDTEKTEFEVFPRYHEGFLIKAGGEPATIIDGMLVDKNKQPLGFKGGQWVPQNKEGKVIAFFSNKAGRFRVSSIPPGRYSLQLFDYPDLQNIYISVPDTKGKVHQIGNILINE